MGTTSQITRNAGNPSSDWNNPLFSFHQTRIVSAISGDDPYIVTADGSRYYVGAELPQGGRLAGVEGDEVLIERNGQVEHCRLPGARLGSSNHQEKRT